jgi:uncharacterized protein GlcG (DUF336 family)
MNMAQRCGVGFLVLLGMSLAAQAAEPASPPRPPQPTASPELITLAEATRMVQAALQDCARRSQPASAAVVDANGFQRVALADDNAKLIGVIHSMRKAAAVLNFKVSTQVLQTRAETDRQFAEQYGKDERYLLQAGGLPIYKNGKLVAAFAVGGAADFNQACAQAGVKAVSWATTDTTGHPQS